MSLVSRGASQLVKGYQRFLSPLLPRACRFTPTCSEYARQAILMHGMARGSWLVVRRLLRCHPVHRGGYDPPPPRTSGAPEDSSRTWKSG